MRANKLHERHRQSLASSLCLAEERVRHMEALLASLENQDAAPATNSRIVEEEKNDVRQKVAELRGAIQEFADRFSIPPEAADTRQMLAGEVAATWLTLESCRPSRLRNNGTEIEPSLSASIEAGVDELVTKIMVLRGKLR